MVKAKLPQILKDLSLILHIKLYEMHIKSFGKSAFLKNIRHPILDCKCIKNINSCNAFSPQLRDCLHIEIWMAVYIFGCTVLS